MEAAKIGHDLRLPIISPVCPIKFCITFFLLSFSEDNAHVIFLGQTSCIMGDVQMANNIFL